MNTKKVESQESPRRHCPRAERAENAEDGSHAAPTSGIGGSAAGSVAPGGEKGNPPCDVVTFVRTLCEGLLARMREARENPAVQYDARAGDMWAGRQTLDFLAGRFPGLFKLPGGNSGSEGAPDGEGAGTPGIPVGTQDT